MTVEKVPRRMAVTLKPSTVSGSVVASSPNSLPVACVQIASPVTRKAGKRPVGAAAPCGL